MTITVYNVFLNKMFQGIDLTTTPLRVTLLNSSYVPYKQHTAYSDIQSYEVVGSGFLSGGNPLSNTTIIELPGTDSFALDADDVIWSNSTITAKTIAIYEESSLDLLCSFVMDEEKSSENGDFIIQWSDSGIVKVLQQAS